MPDLIAIGYDDTATAVEAMDEVGRLAHDLVIQPDAVAAIIRAEDGKFTGVGSQHAHARQHNSGSVADFIRAIQIQRHAAYI